jgi:hypothetical protein
VASWYGFDPQPLFNRFLADVLPLDATREARIEDALLHLQDVITNDDALWRYRPYLFLQGSYASDLGVRPATPRAEFDVDVVIRLRRLPSTMTATRALTFLSDRLRLDRIFASRLVDHDRCVRLAYANEFHVDVVPARALVGLAGQVIEAVQVPFRGVGWRRSNPLGYMRWCRQRDVRTGGDFTRVVWLLKRWRDLAPRRRSIRSIVFTTLIGRMVPPWTGSGQSTRPDGEVLAETLERLERWANAQRRVPVVTNPSLRVENLTKRWTLSDFRAFRTELTAVVTAVRVAQLVGGAAAWRSVFGDSFPSAP